MRERGGDDGVHAAAVDGLLADEKVLPHDVGIERVPTREDEGVGAHDAPQHLLALHVRQRGRRAAVVVRRRGSAVVPVVAEASTTVVVVRQRAVFHASQFAGDDAGSGRGGDRARSERGGGGGGCVRRSRGGRHTGGRARHAPRSVPPHRSSQSDVLRERSFFYDVDGKLISVVHSGRVRDLR